MYGNDILVTSAHIVEQNSVANAMASKEAMVPTPTKYMFIGKTQPDHDVSLNKDRQTSEIMT